MSTIERERDMALDELEVERENYMGVAKRLDMFVRMHDDQLTMLRSVEAERDALRAVCAELVQTLGDMVLTWMLCEGATHPSVNDATTALANARKVIGHDY